MPGNKTFIDIFLKFSGIFILCGWMFFLGVLVGRGTSPISFDTRSFQKKLAVIATGDKKEHKTEKKMNFNFYEMLQKTVIPGNGRFHKADEILPADSDTGELTNRKLINQKLGNQEKKILKTIKIKKSRKNMTFSLSANKYNDSSADKFDISRENTSSTRSANKSVKPSNKSTMPANKSVRPANKHEILSENKSHTLVKNKSGSLIPAYTIQIAAYRNLNDALKLMESLRVKGYKPYRTMGKSGDKIWHRVRIGSFRDMDSAKKIEKKLELISIKGIIVPVDE